MGAVVVCLNPKGVEPCGSYEPNGPDGGCKTCGHLEACCKGQRGPW